MKKESFESILRVRVHSDMLTDLDEYAEDRHGGRRPEALRALIRAGLRKQEVPEQPDYSANFKRIEDWILQLYHYVLMPRSEKDRRYKDLCGKEPEQPE